MPARTVGTVIAAISRHTRGEVPRREISDAISDIYKQINSKYDWPWMFADTNIKIQPSYSTGTISIADQTKTVTLTGGTWDVTWLYKTLLLSDCYYPIDLFTSPTTAVLKQAVNKGTNFVDVGYTIFQQDYPLPDDCEFGSSIILTNLTLHFPLRKIPTYRLQKQQAVLSELVTNFQTGYCDAGYDDATRKYLIRFIPPPSENDDFKLSYRRRVPELFNISDNFLMPESFDEVIELLAEYKVKFRRSMPGWMEAKAEGYQLLQAMRRKMATEPIDNMTSYSSYPPFADVSFYDPGSGAFVGPVTGFGL